MPGRPRPLPSLRYLKLEAKRRLAAGEFPSLHDAQAAIAREHGLPSWAAFKQVCGQPPQESHALPQLRWVIARFRDAGAPGWTGPGDHELRQRFGDRFLAETPAGELIAAITSVAADLREEFVVIRQAPLSARVQLASLQVFASVEADPPHRLTELQAIPAGRPITDTRVAAPPPAHTLGDVPAEMAGIADEAFAELGLAALVLAGSGPDTPVWVIAKGWADVDRAEVLGISHQFPAAGVTVLVTATAVLRLIADGRLGLDGRANDHLRTVRLAGCADLGPSAVTGYSVTPEGAVVPVPHMISTIPAVGGLWATAADIVRLGIGWSSLLPAVLAGEALAPQTAPGPGGGRAGLGWLFSPRGDVAMHAGASPGATASLLVRIRDSQVQATMTNRLISFDPIYARVLRSWTNPAHQREEKAHVPAVPSTARMPASAGLGRPGIVRRRAGEQVGRARPLVVLNPVTSERGWFHLLSIAQSNGIGRRRVTEVLQLTGLDAVAHGRIKGFSLGMKQRLGIATALLGDPPVLIFDEPANGLDPEGIHWIRQLFKSLAAEGRTVFVSSHLMSEMALTADHLIIIGRGKLLTDTPTERFVESSTRRDVLVAGDLLRRRDVSRPSAASPRRQPEGRHRSMPSH